MENSIRLIVFCLIILSIVATISLLYTTTRLLYFMYKNHFDKTNTMYEKHNINKYKRESIIAIPILVTLVMGIGIYFSPVDFKEIINLQQQLKVNEIELRGSLNSNNEIIISEQDEIQRVLEVFSKYKYRNTFEYNNFGGVGEFLYLDCLDRTIIIEVWENGYLRIPNNEVYRVLIKDRAELFNKLKLFLK